jgi:hypothetical protein
MGHDRPKRQGAGVKQQPFSFHLSFTAYPDKSKLSSADSAVVASCIGRHSADRTRKRTYEVLSNDVCKHIFDPIVTYGRGNLQFWVTQPTYKHQGMHSRMLSRSRTLQNMALLFHEVSLMFEPNAGTDNCHQCAIWSD